MNKYTYTVYLNSDISSTSRGGRGGGSSSSGGNKQLDELSHRLDKQSLKMDILDDECIHNLDKCKRIYNIAKDNEAKFKSRAQSMGIKSNRYTMPKLNLPLNTGKYNTVSLSDISSSRRAKNLLDKYDSHSYSSSTSTTLPSKPKKKVSYD